MIISQFRYQKYKTIVPSIKTDKKNTMKKIIFSIIITALLFSGCKKEEIAPLEIADFSVHVGGEGQATAFNVAIDNYLTFLDLSRNAIDHEWRIDEGNFFISDKFSKTDSIFDAFIIPNAGMVSKEKKVNILFKEAGLQPVQIVNTFEEETTEGPATAVQQGGVWVVDTTYMIDVFNNIQPAFKVFLGTEEVLNVSANDFPDPGNSSSWPVVVVEAGQALTYVDVTTVGRPTDRSWTFKGSVPASSLDSAATVSYFTLGTFLGGGFTSQRGGNRPAQEVAKVIPIQVKVVPSTLPFLFDGNLMEQADETITFNVGGELQPFSGQEGAFTVNVINEEAGYNENIPVQLAKVNDSDATKIELKLSAPIFNSDVLTISYSGSDIRSADFRTLSDFGPETVAMHFEDNLLPSDWAGFETHDDNWKKGFCVGFWVGNSNGSADMPHYSRTEDMFASGIASMKLDLYNGMETKVLQGSDFGGFGLLAGDYLLSFKIFLEAGNTMTTLQTVVQEPSNLISWDIEGLPRGEWIELSQPMSFAGDLTGRYDFKIDAAVNPAITDPQVLYIDDYQWRPYEKR